MTRRYCDRILVCQHTGIVSRCSAPLHRGDKIEGGVKFGGTIWEDDEDEYEWYCQICWLFQHKEESRYQFSDGYTVCWSRHSEPSHKAMANEWCFHRAESSLGERRREAFLDNYERGVREQERRPVAIVEETPFYECSNRETLEQMGIAIDSSLIGRVDVRELPDPLMRAWLSGVRELILVNPGAENG